MNIGIDIDDTISETFETILPYAQKYTIEDLKRESKINLTGNLADHFYIVYVNGWNEQEAVEFWEKYYAKILREVYIKKFAAEVINKLRKEGHKVYIITARWDMKKDNVEEITKNWLKQNNVEYDGLFLNASDKLSIAKENNIDIFIDDSFKNCKKVADGSDIEVYMMDSRANEQMNNERIQRVFSWPEIYDIINKQSNI